MRRQRSRWFLEAGETRLEPAALAARDAIHSPSFGFRHFGAVWAFRLLHGAIELFGQSGALPGDLQKDTEVIFG